MSKKTKVDTKVCLITSVHHRGGVSLETEKTESGTTSKLLVTQARSSDSGNYTCIPSNANPASVMVHVLNGKWFFMLPVTHLSLSAPDISSYSMDSRCSTSAFTPLAFFFSFLIYSPGQT